MSITVSAPFTAHRNPLFAEIPVESLIFEHQAGYYQAFQESIQKNDSAPFIAFMLRMIMDTGTASTPEVTQEVTPEVRLLSPFDDREIPAAKSALVEVYPSLWNKSYPQEGRTCDQHDAYAVSAWLRQVDTEGSLGDFLKPSMLPDEYPVAQVEGWILGVI